MSLILKHHTKYNTYLAPNLNLKIAIALTLCFAYMILLYNLHRLQHGSALFIGPSDSHNAGRCNLRLQATYEEEMLRFELDDRTLVDEQWLN